MTTKKKTTPTAAAPSAKQIIADAGLPGITVPIHLGANMDLVHELEDAQRALEYAKRPSNSLAGNGPTGQIEARIAELRQLLAPAVLKFRLEAMDREVFREFVAAHPPRMLTDGKKHPDDEGRDYNAETFFVDLVRESTVSPVLDDDDWLTLLGGVKIVDGEEVKVRGKLTSMQFNELSDWAWALNRNRISLPF